MNGIKIIHRIEDLGYNDFNEPILIKGGCKATVAYLTWNLKKIKKKFKNVPMWIEKYSNQNNLNCTKHCETTLLPFDDYLMDKMKNKNPPFYYCAEIILNDLKGKICNSIHNDIYNPLYKRKVDQDLLFIGYNKRSGCHLHITHDYLLNQIIGKKIIYLFNYNTNQLPMNLIYQNRNNFIKDDFFNLDWSKITFHKIILEPGDSISIPPYWFHATEGQKFNCSITNVYNRSNNNYMYYYPYLLMLYIYNYSLDMQFLLVIILVILIIIYFLL